MRINIESQKLRVDIGCGRYKKDGYIGIDILDFGQEIVWDVRNGIPLPDKSVVEVYSNQFIEHLTKQEFNLVSWEIDRICDSGAKILLSCPHSDVDPAYDVAHFTEWNEKSLTGWCRSIGWDIENCYRSGGDVIIQCQKK